MVIDWCDVTVFWHVVIHSSNERMNLKAFFSKGGERPHPNTELSLPFLEGIIQSSSTSEVGQQLYKSAPQYSSNITLPYRVDLSYTCKVHAFADVNATLLNFAKDSIFLFLRSETSKSIPPKKLIMALPKHFMTVCRKNLQGDRLNNQLFFTLRALHKSAASEALGISAAGEEAMPERLITPADVGEKTRIKTLKEMPGPSTISNLIEFFWKDGFDRIHEIQVMLPMLLLCPILFHRLEYVFVLYSLGKSLSILSVTQICHICVK